MSDERKEAARWLAARATDWEAKLIGVPNWLARHEEWMTKLIAFGGIAPSPAAATTEDDDAIEEAFERTKPAPVERGERRVRQQKPVPLEFGTFGYIRKDSEHTDGAHYDQRRREAGVMTKDVAADVLAFWMLPFDMPPLEQTEARNAIKAAILTLTRSSPPSQPSAERVVEAAKEMSTEVYCSHLDILVDSQEAIVDCECAGCRSRRRFDQSLREYREGGK